MLNVVLTAAYSVLGRWNESYEDIDERRALRVLAEWHLEHLADRTFGTLSDGEQKRVQIARAIMTDPEILLLDEPAASLDLGAREELVSLLGGYAQAPSTPAMIMVTHHVEEIPIGFTHVLLMARRPDRGRRAPARDPHRREPHGDLRRRDPPHRGRRTVRRSRRILSVSSAPIAADSASTPARLIESILGAFAPQTFTALAKSSAPLPRGPP